MRERMKSILIAGCGRMGSALAVMLCKNGYSVIVIDKENEAFQKLSADFSGFEVMGDATDSDVLEEAGIKEAGMMIAATENDNVNCMIAQVASQIYGLKSVFVRLHDPEKEYLIEGMDIQALFPLQLSIKEFRKKSLLTFSDEEEEPV